MDYTIRDRIPRNCRCEGIAISVSDFKKIYGEEHFSVKKTTERLHITERMAAQLARKLKVRK